MSNIFFDSESEQNIQDTFTSQIKPHIENLKRNCLSHSDEQFVSSGITRIISQNKSGREFLQKSEETFNIQIPRATFSDAMHSSRRLDLFCQVSSLNYKSLDQELTSDKFATGHLLTTVGGTHRQKKVTMLFQE